MLAQDVYVGTVQRRTKREQARNGGPQRSSGGRKTPSATLAVMIPLVPHLATARTLHDCKPFQGPLDP